MSHLFLREVQINDYFKQHMLALYNILPDKIIMKKLIKCLVQDFNHL